MLQISKINSVKFFENFALRYFGYVGDLNPMPLLSYHKILKLVKKQTLH